MHTIHNDTSKLNAKRALIAKLDHALQLALELNRQIDKMDRVLEEIHPMPLAA